MNLTNLRCAVPALALTIALALAGCGGGGGGSKTTMTPVGPMPPVAPEPDPTPPTPPVQTAYEAAKEAIADAETAEAAQAIIDELDASAVTGEEFQSLIMLAAERQEYFARVEADEARQMLVDAAACDDATVECVTHHDALIAALQVDVDELAGDAGATNAQQDAAQAALDEATEAREALRAQLAEINRSTATGAAVGAAADAAAGLAQMRSEEDIEAVEALLATARGMLTEADDYAGQVSGIKDAIARARELNAVDAAVMAARDAAMGLTDDRAADAVAAAQGLIDAAKAEIMDAGHLTDAEKATRIAEVVAAQVTVTVARNANDAEAERVRLAEEKAAEEKARQEAAAMAKLGKDLRAALAGNASADTTALDNAVITLSTMGLAVDAAAGAGALADATDPASVTLKAGDSAGALGSWMGMDYVHVDAGMKVMNEARVYVNKGPGKTVSLADAGITVHTDATAGDDIKGHYTVDESADLAKVMGPAFTHSGTQSHAYDADSEVVFTTRGTLNGAPGTYRCTGTCTSTNDGEGSPSALGGVWHFKPDAGAMAAQPDANYLYYGWWVSKDEDGAPTAVSAFRGTVGTIAALITGATPDALTGSATYAGNAAGKFAMSNPLDGTGNGGHFTADAMLTAKFGGADDAGMTGTIDNFRLNDASEDAGWSELKRASWDSGVDTFGGAGNEAMTVWSINGNEAPASGTWSGTMYDEMPGNAPDGDGSNIPTTVTGTFYSEFSAIGRMVGAFGATKQ